MRSTSPTKRQKRFLSLPTFINAEKMVQVLNSKTLGKDFLIIDVRDDDYHGGNIKGSLNIPSKIFNEQIAKLQLELLEIPELYFHCQLSQVRGPKCAQKYVNELNKLEHHAVDQDIYIIRGGYEEFYSYVNGDKKYVENVSFGY
jgi:Cdc25 family phosphatase